MAPATAPTGGAVTGSDHRRRDRYPAGRSRHPGPGSDVPAGVVGGPGEPATGSASLLHLLRRTTYGVTPALLREVTDANRWTWLRGQLDPARIDDAVCDRVLARFEGLDWTPSQVREAKDVGSWDLMMATGQAALARATWSRRQLLELMVELWSNHLNVTSPSDGAWDNRQHYDRTAIRPHALGRFADLLHAAITHPAMLVHLNNASSTKRAPNENLGRELLELHTVGVDAGYTQADVVTAARILTGLSVDWTTGEFRYRPEQHWTGPVRFGAWSSPNAAADGRPVVRSFLDHLARRPETARRLARVLAVRFVADDPPAALVERLAATYLARDTAIAPVLWQLFTSPEFAAAADAKQRRPLEVLVATLRVLEVGPPASGTRGLGDLYWMLEEQGHVPFGWPQPDGYPDVAAAWQSTAGTLERWNTTLDIVAGWWPKDLTRRPLTALLPQPLPATHGELVTALGRRLLHRPLPVAHRDAVCAFLGRGAASPLQATSEAVGWRLPYVVALLLDSPAHVLR